MKKVAFFLLFLFLSCTVLNAAREYCKYAYQEDRAIPLILNYGIRLGVVVLGLRMHLHRAEVLTIQKLTWWLQDATKLSFWVYFTMLEFIFTLILDFTFYSIKTLEKVFLGRTALVILFVVFIALFCVKGLFLYILLALELFLLLYLFLGILFLRFYKS